MSFFYQTRHLFKRTFSSCPEYSNLVSTTFKVNLFTFICTGLISRRFFEVYYVLEKDRKQFEERLNKRLDQLQK
jgi:hypothetical protein